MHGDGWRRKGELEGKEGRLREATQVTPQPRQLTRLEDTPLWTVGRARISSTQPGRSVLSSRTF